MQIKYREGNLSDLMIKSVYATWVNFDCGCAFYGIGKLSGIELCEMHKEEMKKIVKEGKTED